MDLEIEDYCLTCGKLTDGPVYCTDLCQTIDARSPSSTSCSSAVASPQYAAYNSRALSDVPALTSSVLGGKLAAYDARARYSNYSSSSASSTAWSGLSDEDDSNGLSADEDFDAPKSGPFAVKPPALLRPPPLCDESPLDRLTTRGYSPARDVSRSAPARRTYPAQHSSTDDDVEDASLLSPRPRSRRVPSKKPDGVSPCASVVSSSSKRSRNNRASLPSSFALLTISSPTVPSTSHSHAHAHSKGSPSSVNTSATLSTPRLAESTLRGRPREVGDSTDVRARDGLASYKADAERRGRRRSNELDPPDFVEAYQAPGIGNGRSGLRDRRQHR